MNCWEFMRCGREKTGDCPAYTKRSGKVCWLVAGTMCGGEKQGTFARKLGSCTACEFYRMVHKTHEASSSTADCTLSSSPSKDAKASLK